MGCFVQNNKQQKAGMVICSLVHSGLEKDKGLEKRRVQVTKHLKQGLHNAAVA